MALTLFTRACNVQHPILELPEPDLEAGLAETPPHQKLAEG